MHRTYDGVDWNQESRALGSSILIVNVPADVTDVINGTPMARSLARSS